MSDKPWSGPVTTFTVAIDFDGTLITDKWPHEGEDMPYAPDVMTWLLGLKARVVIWTCRTESECPPGAKHSSLQGVRNWLMRHNLFHHVGDRIMINENFPDIKEKFGDSESRKVFAHVYVDDKNLGGFSGWPAAQQALYIEYQRFAKKITDLVAACAT